MAACGRSLAVPGDGRAPRLSSVGTCGRTRGPLQNIPYPASQIQKAAGVHPPRMASVRCHGADCRRHHRRTGMRPGQRSTLGILPRSVNGYHRRTDAGHLLVCSRHDCRHHPDACGISDPSALHQRCQAHSPLNARPEGYRHNRIVWQDQHQTLPGQHSVHGIRHAHHSRIVQHTDGRGAHHPRAA